MSNLSHHLIYFSYEILLWPILLLKWKTSFVKGEMQWHCFYYSPVYSVILLLIVLFSVILVQFVVSNRHCLCCCVADWCYGQMYLTISFVFCMKFCFDLMCCSNKKPVSWKVRCDDTVFTIVMFIYPETGEKSARIW